MGENDGSCKIILELSERETFFEKKKLILQARGFRVRVEIELDCSSSTDSVAAKLEQLLQVERIIHLDEVELYFNDYNGSSPVGFCSARNEVEALYSILSIINKMFPQETSIKGQAFRAAINDRIMKHCMGNDVVKGRVSSSSYKECEKEKLLVEWGVRNGVKTSLEVACKSISKVVTLYNASLVLSEEVCYVITVVEGAGRGAIAAKDLKLGDIALEIPKFLIISDELARQSDMFKVLETVGGVSSETMMLLWSMKERHDTNSKFKIYFDTLPQDFNTGLSFGVDAIMALDGTTLLEEIMQAKEHLRVQYDELVPNLCKEYPETFPLELYTYENFLWCCELWYSNSMKVMFPDGKLRTCLIPVAGFLNHSLHPHITHYGKIDQATNTMKFPLSRPCSAGEQCCLSYGNLSSSHLITFYGFLPQGDNPYDVIPLDIDLSDGTDCSEEPTSHMVRGTWFSSNHGMFHYGLPTPLLDCFRKARNHTPNTTTTTKQDLEMEIEVLEDLASTFNGMMENLGEADSDYGEEEHDRWDMKLASEFKNRHRRIISSILSSCDAGISLLQTHLIKCTN
ncbi:[Fructose-bisphosphate aldolase]-lysine N-methyltransferase, chloroplastic [Linum perenne]